MSIDPRTPVIIGVAQVTDRVDDPELARTPVEMMTDALRSAAIDAGAPAALAGLDLVGAVGGIWRYSDPGRQVATAVGAGDARTLLTGLSGTSPQRLLDHLATLIAAGRIEAAAMVGGEAFRSRRRARRLGVEVRRDADPDLDPAERYEGTLDMATDHEAFERRFTITGDTNTHYLAGRRWELTNTRWILGGTNDVAFFNRQFDPAKSRFTVASNFVVGLRPGTKNPNAPGTEDFTTQFNSAGPYSLIRFDGALPRARLYSQWQVQTNDATTLETLAKREFDPQATVIVNAPIAPSAAALGQAVGEVITQSYRPKEIRLTAQATGDSVLLLNDHWSAHWRVTVDGQPSELLRCNYVMRGVRLSPGSHEVVFRFQPPMTWLYVSLASLLGGFGLLGFVIVDERKNLRLNG